MRRLVPDRQQRLSALARTLHAVSPLPTLDRGYAILTRAEGKGVSSVSEVSPGDEITARLRDGTLEATVRKVHAQPPDPDDKP